MEVFPGIFQFKVPIPGNPLGFLNSYLIKTDEGCMLVDTGWNTDEAFRSLTQQLENAAVRWSDLRYIVITHAHPDHFGLVGRLKKLTKAILVLHKMELAIVRPRYVDFDELVENMGKWLSINGVPDSSTPLLQKASLSKLGYVSLAQPDLIVKGGEHLRIGDYDLEVFWTPGHALGHICLFERKRKILFAGDHILPKITPNVSMHVQTLGNPLADYLNSLKNTAALPVEIVLPAHGEVFNNLDQRVAEIEKHHDHRNQEIMEVLKGKKMTAYQVSSMLTWSEGKVSWSELSDFSKRAAVTETISHLEFLFAKGKLRKINDGGIIYYLSKI